MIMKVKSHIGINESEYADMLANEAAEHIAKVNSLIGMSHKSIAKTLIKSFGLNNKL